MQQRFRFLRLSGLFYFATIHFPEVSQICDDSFTRGQPLISVTCHWRILSYIDYIYCRIYGHSVIKYLHTIKQITKTVLYILMLMQQNRKDSVYTPRPCHNICKLIFYSILFESQNSYYWWCNFVRTFLSVCYLIGLSFVMSILSLKGCKLHFHAPIGVLV